jgi:hypothetical protein
MARTTHRSSKGTKLYAVRDTDGEFTDIQTYKRAHGQDVKRTSMAEMTARKTAAKKTAKKAAPKKAAKKSSGMAAKKAAKRPMKMAKKAAKRPAKKK